MDLKVQSAAQDFHEIMDKHHITLVYEGEINQDITKIFSDMAQSSLSANDHLTTKKRVYHIMVECLQNICKHADEKGYTEDSGQGKGILIVGNTDNQYTITTGNIITNNNVEPTKAMLDRINAMSPEELKENYKKMIMASRISSKGGAGLGFIDMVKKTGNPIEYIIKPIDEENSFLMIISRVNRK